MYTNAEMIYVAKATCIWHTSFTQLDLCKEDKFSARARALAFSSGKQGE
jgi:hypothetical protein